MTYRLLLPPGSQHPGVLVATGIQRLGREAQGTVEATLRLDGLQADRF